MAVPGAGHAQALSGVDLHWQGPPDCAKPIHVLETARGLLGHDGDPRAAVSVRVELRELADGSLSLTLQAQGAGGASRRTLTMPSCEQARQAAALLIALALDPEPERAAPAAEQAPAETTTESSAKPPARHETPRSDRSGATIGVAGGLELPALSVAAGVLTARLGWRWDAIELEAAASVWLPSRKQIEDVELAVDRIGGAATACHWFALEAWELGPCLGLELSRVHAELNDADAGAEASARVALGARLGLWLSDRIALDFAADAMLALHRPRFATGDGESARAPTAGFVARAGISYSFVAEAVP